MPTRDNQPPELTPDWSCDPRPDPFSTIHSVDVADFAAGMSRDELDGTDRGAVRFITGLSDAEIDDLGGMPTDQFHQWMAELGCLHVPANVVLGEN